MLRKIDCVMVRVDLVAASRFYGRMLGLRPLWRDEVSAVVKEATLTLPGEAWMQRGGKQGIHTEHLGRMLATMQWLQRAYPGARW